MTESHYKFKNSKDECIRPSGLFSFDGKPILRTVLNKSKSNRYKKKLSCGNYDSFFNIQL